MASELNISNNSSSIWVKAIVFGGPLPVPAAWLLFCVHFFNTLAFQSFHVCIIITILIFVNFTNINFILNIELRILTVIIYNYFKIFPCIICISFIHLLDTKLCFLYTFCHSFDCFCGPLPIEFKEFVIFDHMSSCAKETYSQIV